MLECVKKSSYHNWYNTIIIYNQYPRHNTCGISGCLLAFDKRKDLIKHIKTIHLYNILYECCDCRERFQSRASRKKHMIVNKCTLIVHKLCDNEFIYDPTFSIIYRRPIGSVFNMPTIENMVLNTSNDFSYYSLNTW